MPIIKSDNKLNKKLALPPEIFVKDLLEDIRQYIEDNTWMKVTKAHAMQYVFYLTKNATYNEGIKLRTDMHGEIPGRHGLEGKVPESKMKSNSVAQRVFAVHEMLFPKEEVRYKEKYIMTVVDYYLLQVEIEVLRNAISKGESQIPNTALSLRREMQERRETESRIYPS